MPVCCFSMFTMLSILLYRRISSENMTLREDQDRKTREIADLSDIGKRREEELQRMDQELKRIGQELANANAAKV